MKHTIGLIGCGHIAKKHLKTISQLDEVELRAVSDIDSGKMNEAMEEYEKLTREKAVIRLYNNYYDLLRDNEIEIVVIATISSLHAEMAIQALLHDKHVMIEKPLALSLSDAYQILEVAEAKGKRILVCHQLRYRPVMQKLKALLEEGALGKLHFGVATMRIHRPKHYYTGSSWKGTWESDGGMLLNQGIHLIDLLIWFMGDVESVYGNIANTLEVKDTEDIAAGLLTFQNKAKGVIEANSITQPNNLGYYLSIFGEEGTISLGGPSFNRFERCYFPNTINTKELTPLLEDYNEHVYMYENFIRALHDKAEHLIMGEEAAILSLMTIFGMYKSSLLKKELTLPLTDFSTHEMIRKGGM
ncbi:Gfo/Idh/MocA family protein [Ornithinibacillus xuwenensis]|uniref:Gfo/Idh/MocA family oxidoreductase n=1 Tax=Ornithinibacillus xuwenensis TaxID=3144668 RepID=A0ABU9XIK4_9BACI